MAANQNPSGFAGGGGFLRIMGIIYLVKLIRKRRHDRRQRAASGQPERSPS